MRDIDKLVKLLEMLQEKFMYDPGLTWERQAAVSGAEQLLDGISRLGLAATSEINSLISMHTMSPVQQEQLVGVLQSFCCELTHHSINSRLMEAAVELQQSMKREGIARPQCPAVRG
jgi:hypothetical protein